MTTRPLAPTAADLDAADPLAAYRDRFEAAEDTGIVYLDGNSLGRPPRAVAERMAEFVTVQWGTRLIRGWGDSWFESPLEIGDRMGRAVLGAAEGQTIIGDSTTVSLYKLIRTALNARPERSEIVIDRANFPTDRYVVQAIADERGATVRWIDTDPAGGVTVADLEGVLGPQTAVVVLSHVAYRSGHAADIPAITAAVHAVGGLVVWDLCHSVGVVPLALDEWGVDYATGCSYKYLNGGPGAPAIVYVRRDLIADAVQPISGWMGVRDSFEMGPEYRPADGIRRFISGTPAVLATVPMVSTLELIEETGIEAIRAKSVALTEFAIALVDALLAPFGVELTSPRDPDERGGHITIDHPEFPRMIDRLWERGILPDFRPPTGIRLGLSPLSTSFAEVDTGIRAIAAELEAAPAAM
jgi:kynureninase